MHEVTISVPSIKMFQVASTFFIIPAHISPRHASYVACCSRICVICRNDVWRRRMYPIAYQSDTMSTPSIEPARQEPPTLLPL